MQLKLGWLVKEESGTPFWRQGKGHIIVVRETDAEHTLQVGGYRDLTVCAVFEDPTGLRIIGEIQVEPLQYLHNVSVCCLRQTLQYFI